MQGHYYPGAFGLFDEEVGMSRGPGPSIATTDYNHGNPGIIGGAMLADDFVFTPMMFWQAQWPDGVPRWGQGAKDWMRRHFHRVTQARGPVQEIPTPHARVELDRHVRDSRGRAVARMSGTTHMETVRTARFMRERAIEWLRAAGATQIWGREPQLALSGHQHQAGTARMGTDPSNSRHRQFWPRLGARQSVRHGRLAARHQWRLQPGADHHGARHAGWRFRRPLALETGHHQTRHWQDVVAEPDIAASHRLHEVTA